VALMQLYERGMFQLTDPVSRYIPAWRTQMVGVVRDDGSIDLVKPDRPMNVRDVLMHTTGLPGALFSGNPIDDRFAEARAAQHKGMTLESITALLAEHPLKFHPGTHWNYGLSTDIVGRLVEILSDQRFDDYLRQEIFEPLDMEDTGFFVPEASAGRLSALYEYQPANTPKLFDDPETSRYLRPRTYLSGAGGLVSTLHDYVAFCQMLLGGGQLADRLSARAVFAAGAGVYVLGYAMFAWQQHQWPILAIGFLLCGLGIGFAETAESTVVAQLLPEHLRSNGFGVLGLVQAFGDLGATLVAGVLWAVFSPTVAFGYAATWMALSVAASGWLRPRSQRPGQAIS